MENSGLWNRREQRFAVCYSLCSFSCALSLLFPNGCYYYMYYVLCVCLIKYSKLWEISATIFVLKCSFPCTLLRAIFLAYPLSLSDSLTFFVDVFLVKKPTQHNNSSSLSSHKSITQFGVNRFFLFFFVFCCMKNPRCAMFRCGLVFKIFARCFSDKSMSRNNTPTHDHSKANERGAKKKIKSTFNFCTVSFLYCASFI